MQKSRVTRECCEISLKRNGFSHEVTWVLFEGWRLVLTLTPLLSDRSLRALHQAPLHWLLQLLSDSAHPSRAAASSFAASSPAAAGRLFPAPLCWKYCTKYSMRVTSDAKKSVTMHSHRGSSRPKYELELSESDILCR